MKIQKVLALAFFLAPSLGLGAAGSLQNGLASVRAVALSAPFLAEDSGVSALDHPAAPALLSSAEVSLQHQSWFAGTFQDSFEGSLPLGQAGALGLGLGYFNWGSQFARDSNGKIVGSFASADTRALLAWSKRWLPNLALGLGVTAMRQQIGTWENWSYSGDLGFWWGLGRGWNLDGSYRNLAASNAGAETRGEVTWQKDLNVENSLLLGLAFSQDAGSSRLHAGAEAKLYSVLLLRAGYKLSFQGQQYGSTGGLSGGLGLTASGWTLDYAAQDFGRLGLGQRISLGRSFGSGVTRHEKRK